MLQTSTGVEYLLTQMIRTILDHIAGVDVLASKKHIRRTVPQSDNLMCETAHWDTERASQTEISQLQLTLVVDEQILRLQVSVKDFVAVTKRHTIKQLVQERLQAK